MNTLLRVLAEDALKPKHPARSHISLQKYRSLYQKLFAFYWMWEQNSLDIHHRRVAFKDVDILIEKGDRWHRPRQASRAVNISIINIAVFFTSLSTTEIIIQCLSLEEKKKRKIIYSYFKCSKCKWLSYSLSLHWEKLRAALWVSAEQLELWLQFPWILYNLRLWLYKGFLGLHIHFH